MNKEEEIKGNDINNKIFKKLIIKDNCLVI